MGSPPLPSHAHLISTLHNIKNKYLSIFIPFFKFLLFLLFLFFEFWFGDKKMPLLIAPLPSMKIENLLMRRMGTKNCRNTSLGDFYYSHAYTYFRSASMPHFQIFVLMSLFSLLCPPSRNSPI